MKMNIKFQIIVTQKEKEEKKRDFIEFYEDGKKSYLANDFKACIFELESAIKNYEAFSSAVLVSIS